MENIRQDHPQDHVGVNAVEKIGVGVSGEIKGHRYEIRNYQIFENDELLARFEVSDQTRPESAAVIERLKKSYALHLLSGDKKSIVESLGSKLAINSTYSEQSPEAKSEIVLNSPHSLMIGDGANDAIALSKSKVGIAVHGSMALSLKAADVYVVTPGLAPIEKLLTLSQETMSIIHRNIALSLAYNSMSVIAVFLGLITPLVAAIIMPLSSLTVLTSTLIGTKKLRRLWR